MVCTKRAYVRPKDAEPTLKLMKKDGYRGRLYVCPDCGLMHIGRKRKTTHQDTKRRRRKGTRNPHSGS
jgi:hypothetical protein